MPYKPWSPLIGLPPIRSQMQSESFPEMATRRQDPPSIAPPKNELQRSADAVYEQYPDMRDWNFEFIDSRPPKRAGLGSGGQQTEFYHPEEPPEYSPNPGTPTIEVFPKDLSGSMLQTALLGDMLHYAKDKNPEFARLRTKFANTLTEHQKSLDQSAYQRSIDEYGEERDFDKWFEVSRLDAYIRGFLAPDRNDEWRRNNLYTQEQIDLMKAMEQTLKRAK